MNDNLHILFVEDQANDAELCQHELRSAGLEFSSERVCTRATYERALAEFAPDLILSDFSMPTDLDGYSALTLAREKAIDVPFIFVSGTIGEERAVAAMKAGATDYVLKDNLDRLGPIVRRALQEARDRRSMQEAQNALKASEATFRSFMQHLPGRASIRDLEGRYTYVNEAWGHAFDLKAEDVIGRPYHEMWGGECAEGVKQAHEHVLRYNEPVKRVIQEGSRWWLSHQFPVPDAEGRPSMVGTIAVDVTEQKVQAEKLTYLAWHDPVTGLANRALLHDRLADALQTAKRDGDTVAVLVWNVQRFRTINDSYGRETGDALLRELAARTSQLWPDLAHMARLSADSFAGFIGKARDASDIAHLLEQSRAALSAPFDVGGKEILIGINAGIACYPNDGADAETLLNNAEAALKQAKTRGEDYLFYETAMNARVAEKLSLDGKLRRALDKDQFVLHYQPKIDLATDRVIGLEALIRWNDPETGLVPPMDFIPLLEETGLILDVGRWAIRKALEDWQARYARGLPTPRIAVNVSAMQLRRADFVSAVERALAEVCGAQHGLDLEITESVLMQDIEGNTEKMHALKAMGVNVAMDDFGTGYSSLSYLAKLPLDALKIDRAFIATMVDEPQSMTIVSTIISLAHTLRMAVVAEGVESPEQAKLLRLLRCEQAQGFFFSRAVPWTEAFAIELDALPRA